MFTGIIEELAQIKEIRYKTDGLRVTISAKIVMDDLEKEDRISLNGVCLTVIQKGKDTFSIDMAKDTLDKPNLWDLTEGDYVNLERALKVSGRLGGHILQGQVETLGVILDKQILDKGALITIGIEPEWMRFCIPYGSVALDGVSLPISKMEGNIIKVVLMPQILTNTTLGIKEKSDTLNIETDIMGKYIDHLLTFEGREVEIDVGILRSIRNIQFGES